MTMSQDFTQAAQPLIDHIQKQIPCTRPHAELLAAKMLTALPIVFSQKPEFFTEALASMAVNRQSTTL